MSFKDRLDSADDNGIGGTFAAASERLNSADRPDIGGEVCGAADMLNQTTTPLRRNEKVDKGGTSVLEGGISWMIGT